MAAALVVSGRPEAAARLPLELEPVEEGVEGEVEVVAALLAVRDHVEARAHLVRDRGRDRVSHCLLPVVRAQLAVVQGRELEPAGKRIAPDHRRPDRIVRHGRIQSACS